MNTPQYFWTKKFHAGITLAAYLKVARDMHNGRNKLYVHLTTSSTTEIKAVSKLEALDNFSLKQW